MGTNYYATRKDGKEEFHIGKSSSGWKFLFQDTPYYTTYEGLKDFFKDHIDTGEWKIINEYGEDVSSKDFIGLVERKQSDPFDDNICNFANDIRNENGYRFMETDFW